MGRNKYSEKTRGKGYWLALHCQKHMRVHTGTGNETCVVCCQPIDKNKHYIYVVPTSDCIHMSGCLSLYPKSIWIESGTVVKTGARQTKQQQEDSLLYNTAVCEVVVEGRSVEEVAEEFDLDVETLTKEVKHAKATEQV